MSKVAIDHIARTRAVDPRYSYIVQAPAGSGKTELLTDRILALLTTVQRPEEILAITFTRKAAAEMHDRVLQKLESAREAAPAEDYLLASWQKAREVLARDQAMGWNLLDNPNRLRIQTIDAFCQALVRLAPSLSGSGAALNTTEADRALMQKAAQKLLNNIDKYDCVKEVLAHIDVNTDRFQSLLVEMLSKRQSWLELAQSPDVALRRVVMTLSNIVKLHLEKVQQLLPINWFDTLQPILLEGAIGKRDYLLSKDKDPELNEFKMFLDWDGKSFAPTMDDIKYWKGLSCLLTTNDGTLRKSVTVLNTGLGPKSSNKTRLVEWISSLDLTVEQMRLIGDIKTLPSELINPDNLPVLKNFFACLALAESALQEVFQEEGSVDFTEVAQRALACLGDSLEPTNILLKLDNDLQHILIDEFQDTSFSQMSLLTKITSGWEKDKGKTLFLVGDPMQSIYRFRNAEVSLFLDIAHKAAKNADKPSHKKEVVIGNVVMDLLLLQENFRSDAGVVNWVNNTFTKIFPAQDNPSLGAIRYTPSHPFNEGKAEPAVQYYPFKYQKDVEGSQQEALLASQQQVVSLVQQALQRHPNSKNAVAILVRSRSHLDKVADALTAANIPVQAVKMVPLGQTEEVVDLVQLIRALHHAADRLAWMSLLRSPFCGLKLVSLTRLFEDKNTQTVPAMLAHHMQFPEQLQTLIGKDEAARLMFVAHALLDKAYLHGETTFSAHVEQVWHQLGGHDLYATPAAQENIRTVLDVVDTLAPYGGLDLAQFDERIRELYAAPTSEQNAVQIMTMHSSKGLEFEEVILYGLERKPKGNPPALLEIESEQGNLLLGPIAHVNSEADDPLSKLIRQRNNERQENETDRLLYVACTRAREKLHLVYVVQEEQGAKRSMLARLDRAISSEELYPLTEPGQVIDSMSVAPSDSPDTWAFDNSLLKRYTLDTIHQLEPATSQVSGDIYNITGGTWIFQDKEEASVGTVTHTWLEQMGRDKLQNWSTQRIEQSKILIQRQLRQLGVHADSLENASHRVIQLLQAVLADDTGCWLLSHPNAHQEWALFNEDNQLRVVDCVMSDEQGWLVVDYKTDKRRMGESEQEFCERLRGYYTDQLTEYADYLQGIDGRPTKMAIYALDGCLWIALN
ncbi:UvrD-helicase domain-containing protein [Pelistega europaea]|uniref:DNA 3'-5' helicase n=1 Tax=Pelistega europaea TaxID=106147 RepID=A0A7Y4P4G4_9BURK|nr:UvrD-helicase domain-containing protein [Pelistega europaea]NOL49471.1 UvrD-helicase domain-containing protein [Pelistega europaea]